MKSNRRPGPLPPIRVRREPPTVEEAVTAAQGLTDDLKQQAEIAAGLMGLSEDEVRPHVARASRTPRASQPPAHGAISAGSRRTAVVVERRTRPRVHVPPHRIEQPR
jgi:hypothetical protein